MNPEKPNFNPGPPKKDDKEIKGEGFVMSGKDRKPSRFSSSSRASVEFRPGATNEEAIRTLEKENAERERLNKEYREKEAKMTPQEKAQRAEEWARQDRNWMVEWFEDVMKKDGEYSETLGIEKDGSLNREKRINDGFVPFIVTPGDLKSSEDLYQLMHKISQEHPQLNISFEVDPNRKWIKYRVSKKVESKG